MKDLIVNFNDIRILSIYSDLVPNTQYAVYTTSVIVTNTSKVQSINDDNDNDDNPAKVESSPSETLVAWTDPAFPAFVEVTLVLVSLVQLPGMYW